MAEVDGRRPGEIAQQWQSLAEKRRAHLLALYSSGRWRRYYSEEQMMAQMRDLVRTINAWNEVGTDLGSAPNPALHGAERWQ